MDRLLKAAIIFGGGYAVLSFLLVYFLGPKKEESTGLPTRGQCEAALEIANLVGNIIEKHSPDDSAWAVRFLKKHHPALDGKLPLDLLATPDGRSQIEALLKAEQRRSLEKS